MRNKMFFKTALVLVMLVAVVFSVTAQGQQDGEQPIKVGHLTYHTGPWADVGPWFDGMTEFAIDVVNENPPLGRKLTAIHQDIGPGEAQAAKKLIERENVDILLNPGHGYLSYRDWILDYIEANDAPLMPSVVGGGIEGWIGGTAEEPIFRASPMDTTQATAAVIKAKEEGAERVVIVASEVEGSQLQYDAGLEAAEKVGLNVVDSFSVQPEANSYRNELQRIGDADPDALLFFSQAQDGGTMVKQAAEAGLELLIIGTSEWFGKTFARTAGESALESHEAVLVAGFTYNEGPAWDWFVEAFEEWVPEYREETNQDIPEFDTPENPYFYQFTDAIVSAALAIEEAGSLKASEWAPAMREIAMEPGEKVYTYEEGIEAIRNGEEINYEGVTGSYDFTETGIVSGLFGIFQWENEEDLEQIEVIEGTRIMEVEEGMHEKE